MHSRGFASVARLQVDNVKRLHDLRDRDARALEELADLMQALEAQLALARFGGGLESGAPGATAQGASGIVSEVWARVEGLSAFVDENVATCEPPHQEPSET